MTGKQSLIRLTLLVVTFFAIQCGGTVKRIKTHEVIDLSGRWNDTDARLVAEEMMQDIVIKPWLNNFINIYHRQPVLIVGEIVNRSHEHIESDPFIKDIERSLINAQKVRIVTHGTFRERMRNEIQDQQNRNSTNLQKKLCRELGADFMLFGSINAIVDSKLAGKERVIFYQVNLELADLATNEIVWIGEKKIKKHVKK